MRVLMKIVNRHSESAHTGHETPEAPASVRPYSSFSSGLQAVFPHVPLMNTATRRQFLQATAVGALALSQFPTVLRAADPDRKLKLGLIGCGWYGMVDVKAAVQGGGGGGRAGEARGGE